MRKKRAQNVIAPTVSAHHANAAKRLRAANAAAVNHKTQSKWIRVHIIYIVIIYI